ncbi:MAG: RNA-binding protein [Rhodospirillales bacterium]|nr:RNA-binding protein [Rhodospirillales bacterium]
MTAQGRRATPNPDTTEKNAAAPPPGAAGIGPGGVLAEDPGNEQGNEQGDGLGDEPELGPLRRCAVTRERLAKERMIRFVVGPERRIVPDLAARLPGRGIWLSARGDVIETARTRGAFARAARGSVTVPPDLTSGLAVALERRIGDTLGLARRAGQAVCGFDKAREWLAAGRVGLVLQARDGSSEERARFLGRWTQVPVVTPLDAAGLGAPFGRDHAVHVVVAPGRLAEMLQAETARLAGVRGEADGRDGTDGGSSGRV